MQIDSSLRRFVQHERFVRNCFIAFVAVRLALLVLIPMQPSSDASWYYTRALELAARGVYQEGGVPTAYWPVGYPAALALVFRFAGASLLAAKLANVIFAAISFWALYLLVRRLFDEYNARIAVLLLTVYPNHIAYVPATLTEHLFTALLLCGALLCTRRSAAGLIAAGVVFGAATLVKTQTILIAPALACVLMWDRWNVKSLLRAALASVAIGIVAFIVVLPWSLRNLTTFGEFVFVSTNGGMSLLAGNNPSVVGDYRNDYSEEDPLVKAANFSVPDQLAADRRARDLAWHWIRENPRSFVALIPKKVFRLWAPDGEGEWQYQAGTPVYDEHQWAFRAVRIINQLFYFGALILFALALVTLIRSRAPPRAYTGFVLAAAVTAICIVFSGQSRYHFPVMPFVFAYAGCVLRRYPALTLSGTRSRAPIG